jgi:hypothetical protein
MVAGLCGGHALVPALNGFKHPVQVVVQFFADMCGVESLAECPVGVGGRTARKCFCTSRQHSDRAEAGGLGTVSTLQHTHRLTDGVVAQGLLEELSKAPSKTVRGNVASALQPFYPSNRNVSTITAAHTATACKQLSKPRSTLSVSSLNRHVRCWAALSAMCLFAAGTMPVTSAAPAPAMVAD